MFYAKRIKKLEARLNELEERDRRNLQDFQWTRTVLFALIEHLKVEVSHQEPLRVIRKRR